jgi:hypothetical protein
MIVVGCGRSKLPRAAMAKELYTGSLFRMARRYAEASGEVWVILSAAHGVIAPETVIRPYNSTPPQAGEALERWARTAALEIEAIRGRDLVGVLSGRPVEILAGKTYAAPLARQLDGLDIVWTAPLEGLGTGERLRKLRRMADSLQASAKLSPGIGKDRHGRRHD